MRKSLVVASTLTIAFLAFNLFQIWNKPHACEEPIAYSLGSFDTRFNISQKYFLSALAEAEAIWEKPLGKELFVYQPEQGDLSVNLIYDSRQETTKTLSSLGEVVEEDEATYNALQARYEKLKSEYSTAKSVYESLVENFNNRNDAYQDMVDVWNKSKRNSKGQFDRLEEERINLQQDAEKLKVLEKQLNEVVSEINSLVDTLNRIAKSLNLNVETYNTVGASRGESFTGGLYSQVKGEQSIDIYEFSSREKLVRVLAHELGHALGLEHVDDKKAIMYYLNEGEAGVLTDVDLAALEALCYTPTPIF
ncbi:MAG: matrixin family metalloprotease [Minisyncoccia bacterium]